MSLSCMESEVLGNVLRLENIYIEPTRVKIEKDVKKEKTCTNKNTNNMKVEVKNEEAEAKKAAKKEEKRLSAIVARAEAKASKIPRAKKAAKIAQVQVIEQIDFDSNSNLNNMREVQNDSIGLQEDECIEVEEVIWNGSTYLLSSVGVVYNSCHEEVGMWCNGGIVMNG